MKNDWKVVVIFEKGDHNLESIMAKLENVG